MSAHPTKLELRSTRERVGARIHDLLDFDSFFDAEAMWAPARVRIRQGFWRRGISGMDGPESLHWDWSRKVTSFHETLGGALSAYRLFGIDVDDEWQGLLLAGCASHRSRMVIPPKEIIYIDYFETAPWNWPIPLLAQEPRYRGIGRQLFAQAIRWSRQLGFKGRVGLHSLPQAEPFYRDHCRMTDLGPDQTYRNLRYFEMTETQSEVYLTRGTT